MSLRKVLHIDLDAFFCAMEELRCPYLKDKPFAVGRQLGERIRERQLLRAIDKLREHYGKSVVHRGLFHRQRTRGQQTRGQQTRGSLKILCRLNP